MHIEVLTTFSLIGPKELQHQKRSGREYIESQNPGNYEPY